MMPLQFSKKLACVLLCLACGKAWAATPTATPIFKPEVVRESVYLGTENELISKKTVLSWVKDHIAHITAAVLTLTLLVIGIGLFKGFVWHKSNPRQEVA